MNLQFSGFGTNGCSLDLNIPCNASVPFYAHGQPIVAAHALTDFPYSPTWNNIAPLIGPQLGTFQGPFKRTTFEVVSESACGGIRNISEWNGLSFLWKIDEEVKEGAGLIINETLMNADIVVGAYVNFTC